MDQKPVTSVDGMMMNGVSAGRPPHYLEQFFSFAHLPPHLQAVSAQFAALADKIGDLPDNPEKSTAMRKLLEAKDCAVRAVLFKG